MTSFKILACCTSVALSSMAIPASAAHVITITGQYSLSEDSNAREISVLYRYIYDPRMVVTTGSQFPGPDWSPDCVYDCRAQSVPIRAVSGKIGNTAIPYHFVEGSIGSLFDDAPFISAFLIKDNFPFIQASFQTSSSPLDTIENSVLYDGYGDFDIVFPSGSSQRLESALVTIEAVPEPQTWLMLLIGFGAIGAVVRRERGSLRHASSYYDKLGRFRHPLTGEMFQAMIRPMLK